METRERLRSLSQLPRTRHIFLPCGTLIVRGDLDCCAIALGDLEGEVARGPDEILGTVSISSGERCERSVSADHLELLIDWRLAPAMVRIGLQQELIRFASQRAMSLGWSLVHGSAMCYGETNCALAVVDGDGVLGKTSLSVELALRSGRYLGDEFLFLELASNLLHRAAQPIHVRSDTRNHLALEHDIYLPPAAELYRPDDLGLMPTDGGALVSAFCLIVPGARPSVERLSVDSATEELTVALGAHGAKFSSPILDRASLWHTESVRSVSSDEIIRALPDREEVIRAAQQLARSVPTIRIIAPSPHDAAEALWRTISE